MNEEAQPREENSNVLPRAELKAYQKKASDRKQGFIREISKVLTDLEESNKQRRVVYFSSFYRKPVFDSTGTRIGLVKDLGISRGDRFPEVSHLLFLQSGQKHVIPWHNVKNLSDKIMLDKPIHDIEKRGIAEDDVFLGEHILDKQVVDVNGLKVIRVNDIALTYIKNKLAVVNIDVGTKSIFRRLGFEKLAEWLPLNISDHPVPWESVEPLAKSEKIHLKVQCARVSELHPADVAELFDELSLFERRTILRSMKSETAAKVLLECEPQVQTSIIKSLKVKRAAAILEKMSANSAANLLQSYGREFSEPILKSMQKQSAEKVQQMLAFEEGTAARYMSSDYISVPATLTVEDAISCIRRLAKHPDILYYVYCEDENLSFCGSVSLKRLILSDAKAMVSQIMNSKAVSVDINDPIEYAGELVTKYDLMAIPVIDVYGKIHGVINVDDILDVVIGKAKANEPIELSDVEKEVLIKEKGGRFHFQLIKDASQFIGWLERIRPRKKNGRT